MYEAGATLIEQQASTSDVYFIISGRCYILVGQTTVAMRGPRDAVGEMVVIDPTAPRSATVRAAERVLAFKVPGNHFEKLANCFPSLWQASAKILTERLRERGNCQRQPRQTPITFVGSSSETKKTAQVVQSCLQGPTEVVLWTTTDVFNPSSVTIDVLTRQATHVDFAIIVLGPDDKVVSRRKQQNAPRDNVIFELGLFVGALGLQRTFILHERGHNIKIPTDLLGVTRVLYRRTRPLVTGIASACNDMIKKIQRLGPL